MILAEHKFDKEIYGKFQLFFTHAIVGYSFNRLDAKSFIIHLNWIPLSYNQVRMDK